VNAQPYRKLKAQILYYEDILLRTLCYDLSVDHPYYYLIRGARRLFPKKKSERAKVIAQTGWSVLNDSFSPILSHSSGPCLGDDPNAYLVWSFSLATPLSVLYPPNVIAAAALFVACQQLGEGLPEPPPRTTSETTFVSHEESSAIANGLESGEESEGVWCGPWYELFQAPPEGVRGTPSPPLNSMSMA
jgi:hypothetical protein